MSNDPKSRPDSHYKKCQSWISMLHSAAARVTFTFLPLLQQALCHIGLATQAFHSRAWPIQLKEDSGLHASSPP